MASVIGAGWSAPASADTTISATGGAKDHYIPGRPVPVMVTVKADRLIRGVVRVTPNGAGRAPSQRIASSVEVPIEVAAATTRTVVVTVPTSSATSASDHSDFTVTAELVQEDTPVAQTSLTVSAKDWEETVAVLPRLTAQRPVPDTVAMRFGSGTAHLLAIDPVVLEAGAPAFGPFATVVAAGDDLEALSPAARDGLLTWVSGGGHLLIDASAAPVAGLAPAWQPVNGWTVAGGGDIRLTRGSAAAGDWSDILDPTDSGSSALSVGARDQSGADDRTGTDFATIETSLGQDAGFHLPEMGQLIDLLIVYVLIVGPLTFVVLARMKRQMVAWVAVPLLAVLFTATFAVAGSGLRNSTDAAHGTVIDITASGAVASTSALIGSIDGGTVDLEMPRGWGNQVGTEDAANAGNQDGYLGYGPPPTRVPTLTGSATAVTATMGLNAGEFALVQTTGPVGGYDGALSVEARTNGATVTGTVKNNLDVELREVTVIVDQSALDVGTVAAHGAASYRVLQPMQSGPPLPELTGWPINTQDTPNGGLVPARAATCSAGPCTNSAPPRRSDGNTLVNSALWREFARSHRASLRAPGTVSAVGWTDKLPAPVHVGDRAIERGRTAIVSHATITVDALDSVGVRIEAVRDADLRTFDAPGTVAPDPSMAVNGLLYRIVLPPTVGGRAIDFATVTIRPPPGLHAIAVPGGHGWTILPEQTDPIAYRLSSDDVVNGVVYVRTRLADHLDGGADTTGWQVAIGDGTGARIVVGDASRPVSAQPSGLPAGSSAGPSAGPSATPGSSVPRIAAPPVALPPAVPDRTPQVTATSLKAAR